MCKTRQREPPPQKKCRQCNGQGFICGVVPCTLVNRLQMDKIYLHPKAMHNSASR